MKNFQKDCRFYFNNYYFSVEVLRTHSHQRLGYWWQDAVTLFEEAGLSPTPSKFLRPMPDFSGCPTVGLTKSDQALLRNFFRRNSVDRLTELREELHALVMRAMWRPVASAPPPAPPAPPPNTPVFGTNGQRLRGRAAAWAPDREEAGRTPAFLYGEQAEAQSDEKTKVKQNQ